MELFVLNPKLHESHLVACICDVLNIKYEYEDNLQLFNLESYTGISHLVLFGYPFFDKGEQPITPNGIDAVFFTCTYGDIPENFITRMQFNDKEKPECNLHQIRELSDLRRFNRLADMYIPILNSYLRHDFSSKEEYTKAVKFIKLLQFLENDVTKLVNSKIYKGIDFMDDAEVAIITDCLYRKLKNEIYEDVKSIKSSIIRHKGKEVNLYLTYTSRNVNELAKAIMTVSTLPTIVCICKPTKSQSSDFMQIRTKDFDAREFSDIIDRYRGKENASTAFFPSRTADLLNDIKTVLEKQ